MTRLRVSDYTNDCCLTNNLPLTLSSRAKSRDLQFCSQPQTNPAVNPITLFVIPSEVEGPAVLLSTPTKPRGKPNHLICHPERSRGTCSSALNPNQTPR